MQKQGTVVDDERQDPHLKLSKALGVPDPSTSEIPKYGYLKVNDPEKNDYHYVYYWNKNNIDLQKGDQVEFEFVSETFPSIDKKFPADGKEVIVGLAIISNKIPTKGSMTVTSTFSDSIS